jgi:hypothetical protein
MSHLKYSSAVAFSIMEGIRMFHSSLDCGSRPMEILNISIYVKTHEHCLWETLQKLISRRAILEEEPQDSLRNKASDEHICQLSFFFWISHVPIHTGYGHRRVIAQR